MSSSVLAAAAASYDGAFRAVNVEVSRVLAASEDKPELLTQLTHDVSATMNTTLWPLTSLGLGMLVLRRDPSQLESEVYTWAIMPHISPSPITEGYAEYLNSRRMYVYGEASLADVATSLDTYVSRMREATDEDILDLARQIVTYLVSSQADESEAAAPIQAESVSFLAESIFEEAMAQGLTSEEPPNFCERWFSEHRKKGTTVSTAATA